LNRYNGKERPGKVRSPNGPLGSRWAYPPGIAESGVGPLETIAGLVVFVLLALVCTKAFRGAAAYRMEIPQVRALPDAAPAADGLGKWVQSNQPDHGGPAEEYRGGRQ
jgi:hypothetical protein